MRRRARDFLTGQLQVFLGPRENSASDDLETVIIGVFDVVVQGSKACRPAVRNKR